MKTSTTAWTTLFAAGIATPFMLCGCTPLHAKSAPSDEQLLDYMATTLATESAEDEWESLSIDFCRERVDEGWIFDAVQIVDPNEVLAATYILVDGQLVQLENGSLWKRTEKDIVVSSYGSREAQLGRSSEGQREALWQMPWIEGCLVKETNTSQADDTVTIDGEIVSWTFMLGALERSLRAGVDSPEADTIVDSIVGPVFDANKPLDPVVIATDVLLLADSTVEFWYNGLEKSEQDCLNTGWERDLEVEEGRLLLETRDGKELLLARRIAVMQPDSSRLIELRPYLPPRQERAAESFDSDAIDDLKDLDMAQANALLDSIGAAIPVSERDSFESIKEAILKPQEGPDQVDPLQIAADLLELQAILGDDNVGNWSQISEMRDWLIRVAGGAMLQEQQESSILHCRRLFG